MAQTMIMENKNYIPKEVFEKSMQEIEDLKNSKETKTKKTKKGE